MAIDFPNSPSNGDIHTPPYEPGAEALESA